MLPFYDEDGKEGSREYREPTTLHSFGLIEFTGHGLSKHNDKLVSLQHDWYECTQQACIILCERLRLPAHWIGVAGLTTSTAGM